MNNSFAEKVSYYGLIALILVLPFWVLPYTTFPLEINKAFLFYSITIVVAILWLVSVLQKASFQIPKSAILLSVGGIVLIWFIASLFSANPMLSLIGGGQEIGTFFSLILLGIALFLISSIFQSEKRVISFYLALFTSAIIVFIFQLFHTGFSITLSPWDIFGSKIANTIGSWNEVGIFFGLIALLSVVLLELTHLKKWIKIFLFVILISSLISLASVNFTPAWIALGIFSLVLLVYLFSIASTTGESAYASRKLIRFTVAILIIALFFVMAKALIGDFVSSAGISSVEVRPAWNSTWQVVKNVLKENILVGSGPNTFLYNWLQFKPADINLTLFWAFPFQSGIGFLPTWLAAGGILGGLAWLAFLVFILYSGFKVITYSENETLRALLVGSFFGSLYLWTFVIIYTPGFLLFSLAFLMTGIFCALLVISGKIKVIEVSFGQNPKIGFIASLLAIFLIIVGVSAFYLLFQKYWAAYSFGRGVTAFNVTGNIDEAENFINRASRFDQQDRYYRTLSEIGLVRLQQLLGKTNLPVDEVRAQFQNILASTITNAQTAARLNPLDFANWMTLGQIYEAILPFNVAGSKEAALSAYKEAQIHAPFDPRPLLASARVEIQANDIKSAKVFLESAISLKRDFASALFLLSRLEAQQGNLKEAIARTEQTLFLAPNDVGVLFQLGLLYYQNKNYEMSRLAFEKVISINPDYSNARYFLGLIYDGMGKKQDAVAQFKRIEELNPDNAEVKKILVNLAAEKPALENISPPQPSPEKREQPPIEEAKPEKNIQKKQ